MPTAALKLQADVKNPESDKQPQGVMSVAAAAANNKKEQSAAVLKADDP